MAFSLFKILEKLRVANMVVNMAPCINTKWIRVIETRHYQSMGLLLLICDEHWTSSSNRPSPACGPPRPHVLVAVDQNKKFQSKVQLDDTSQNGVSYANPWVLKSFGSRDALGRINRQHLIDEIFRFWCHRIPFRWRVLKTDQMYETTLVRRRAKPPRQHWFVTGRQQRRGGGLVLKAKPTPHANAWSAQVAN